MIQETIFGPKRYLTLKKSIAISQVSDHDMYDQAGKKLGMYIKDNNLTVNGPWSVIYFTWDIVNQKAELGIAFPIANLETVSDPELSITDIPESKASMDTPHGPYEGLAKVHQGLAAYMTEKGYDEGSVPVMAVEEYVDDPMSEPNPENWVTNIYYLHG